MTETSLIVGQQRRVVSQGFMGTQQQLTKVHQALGFALLLIHRIDINQAIIVIIPPRLHVGRATAFIFLTIDKAHRLARRKFFIIQIQLANDALDGF